MVDLNKLVDSRPISVLPAASAKKSDARAKAKKAQDTAGPAWFNMPAPTMTPELEKDLRLIRMRQALDPKKHYKASKAGQSKYFHVGTVVASAEEFYTGQRLSRKQQAPTILDTLLKDSEKQAYFKKKFAASQKENRAGGKLSYKQKQADRKAPWKR